MAPNRQISPIDYELIRNTIALYCIALDTKDFDLFNKIFLEDVVTVYPFGGQRRGVDDIKAAIEKRLSPVVTQHAITTQHITFKPDGPMAVVTSYFTGIHFGQGRWKGKEVTAWRKYQDIMVSEREGDDWKIAKREVSFMGRLGEEGVMDGE